VEKGNRVDEGLEVALQGGDGLEERLHVNGALEEVGWIGLARARFKLDR